MCIVIFILTFSKHCIPIDLVKSHKVSSNFLSVWRKCVTTWQERVHGSLHMSLVSHIYLSYNYTTDVIKYIRYMFKGLNSC